MEYVRKHRDDKFVTTERIKLSYYKIKKKVLAIEMKKMKCL